MACTLVISQRRIQLPTALLATRLRVLRDVAGYSAWDVGCRITSDRAVAALNLRYRRRRGPTDILSFAFHELSVPEAFPVDLQPEERNLGDLIISAQTVARYCAEQGIDPLRHYDVLFAHGIAHLLGYDHETDDDYRAMSAVEARLLGALESAVGSSAASVDVEAQESVHRNAARARAGAKLE